MKLKHLLFLSFLIGQLLIILYGESICKWPPGSGYVNPPKNVPLSPHEVKKTTSTKAEIIAASNGRFLLSEKSSVEYRESKSLFIFPGSKISNLCKSRQTLTLVDYNGDECILPYGLTVKVDEYGQFIPIKYDPKKK